jgi:cerevisin
MMSLARHYLRYYSSSTLAPLIAPHHSYGIIKNSYIVMLKPNVSSSVLQNHLKFLTAAHESDPLQLDGDVKSGIRHVFRRGYTGMFTDGVVDKIREMPEVDFVEKDQIVRMYTPVDT